MKGKVVIKEEVKMGKEVRGEVGRRGRRKVKVSGKVGSRLKGGK